MQVSAISTLHDAGIIHGDLRPESILFKSDGHLVVTDFNFSFVHGSSNMRPSRLPVMNHYQAPEILLGWRYDFSVDCWAFGILLYMMLFGMVWLQPS
jgi:serine/threonine protein kinase